MQEVDHLDSIDHLPLSRARVDATPGSDDASGGSIEVLILQLTLTAAVDGEGKVRTEGLYIKVVPTPLPISSSGVKPMQIRPWGSSGCLGGCSVPPP